MTPAILYLIDILRWRGGTEIHLLELATRLEKNGFKPIVCNLGGDEPVLRDMAAAGVETWPRLMHRIYAPAGRKTIRQVIAEAGGWNIAAVQTFHFKSDWMGASVTRALGAPLISSRRDLGFSQTALRKLVYALVNRRVDAFIAPSDAVKRAVCEREGVPPERVQVIYNGLDLTRFDTVHNRLEAREWLGVPPDNPLAGMVTRFRPNKDHPTLLKAWRQVVDPLPDPQL
ncbi:MAG: glycosyltransferase, partial [candidate division Zixibacteria bacterium]|nr:glycosyltransferase [candidate division Zixibacteria bacterium]